MMYIRRKCFSHPMFGTPTGPEIMENGENLSKKIRHGIEDGKREANQLAENAAVKAERLKEDSIIAGKRAWRNVKEFKNPFHRTTGDKIADATRGAGRKVADSFRHVKHEYQDLSDNYAQDHGHSLERDLAIGGAAVAAVGAGGYAAYKAWKKKQAKKKAAAAQAEEKFKK